MAEGASARGGLYLMVGAVRKVTPLFPSSLFLSSPPLSHLSPPAFTSGAPCLLTTPAIYPSAGSPPARTHGRKRRTSALAVNTVKASKLSKIARERGGKGAELRENAGNIALRSRIKQNCGKCRFQVHSSRVGSESVRVFSDLPCVVFRQNAELGGEAPTVHAPPPRPPAGARRSRVGAAVRSNRKSTTRRGLKSGPLPPLSRGQGPPGSRHGWGGLWGRQREDERTTRGRTVRVRA